MDKEIIIQQYEEYKDEYLSFQREIINFVEKIREDYKNIDIAEIKERPRGEIKSLDSIFGNLNHPEKYKGYSSIFEIKDIAGVRVICHCEDDYSALAEIIDNQLRERRFLDINKENKGGGNINPEGLQKSSPSYRAIHFTFSKRISSDIKIIGEIQIRTVMGDAWAVQDRRYRYGNAEVEGDSHTLAKAVAEIMNGCEGLWTLVKQKCNNIDLSEESIDKVYVPVHKQIITLKQDQAGSFDKDLLTDKLL